MAAPGSRPCGSARRGGVRRLEHGRGHRQTACRRRGDGRIRFAHDRFHSPGWLASPGAKQALRAAGFTYTTSHFGAEHLGTGRRYRGFALSHRPGGGWSERFGAAMLETVARRTAERGGLVRLALHPDDLSRPGLRDSTLRAIDAVLRTGAHAITYGELVGSAVG